MSDYDVIIVGAGPSGAILARNLGANGKRVLLLDAGGDIGATWEQYQANVARYRGSAVRVPNAPYYSSGYAPSPSVLDITKIPQGGVDASGYFVQKGPLPFGSDYLRAKGGTTMHWEGTSLRMVPNDFFMKSRYGQTTADWPMTYDQLIPYYDKAERELGVAADVGDQGYLGITFSDNYVYPMHKVPLSYSDTVIGAALDNKSIPLDGTNVALQVTSTPAARNSTPNPAYDGGMGYAPIGAVGNEHRGHRCEGNSSCIPICPVQAKYSALKTLDAMSSNVTLVTQAVVSSLALSADTKSVTGVTYLTYTDVIGEVQAVTATATVYVLAANAIENAKLLLASGASNTSHQVGMNLMDHPFVMTWGLMPENVGAFRGPLSTAGIEILRDGPFRSTRAAFRVEIANWGWDFCAFAPYGDVETAVRGQRLYGADLREWLGNFTPRQIRFGFLFEQLPSPDNNVTIDNAWKDALGQPRPVIRYTIDKYTRAGMVAAAEMTAAAFKLLGASNETQYNPADPGYLKHDGMEFSYHGAGHVCGTHVMGNDAKRSVTDTSSRSWDQQNLYVVGCGSLPTVATSNPTLTMTALVFKALEGILADLGGPSA